MEEIRKQRLVRGNRLRVMGMRSTGGVGRSALRASTDVLSIVNAPSLSSHERKPQTVGETASAETWFRLRPRCGFALDNMDSTPGQAAARHPLVVIFGPLHGFLYLPERGVSGISAGQIVTLLFLGGASSLLPRMLPFSPREGAK